MLLTGFDINNQLELIKNTNKKWSGIDAIQYNDENDFLNKLRHHIKHKKYFLFGSDSCKIVTKYYLKLIAEFELQKEDFILITGDTDFRPTDASEQFKNKYVFYSPSITTGVSFVYKDVKQSQFIYISKTPKITPISMYQMSCQTRNMKTLNIYCSEQQVKAQQFEILKEVENKYTEENMIESSRYGYNFHKTTSFPEQEFEKSCINNTKQWLTKFKKKQDEQ